MDDTMSTLLKSQENQTRSSSVRYEDDLYGWALEQASLIKTHRLSELDVINLADEILDVARREVHELESRLSVLILHLLKWDVQKQRRGDSWVRLIREQRRQVTRLLQDSPSLMGRIGTIVSEAYTQGRVAALNETKLSDGSMPETNPYSWDEIMTRPVEWPEP